MRRASIKTSIVTFTGILLFGLLGLVLFVVHGDGLYAIAGGGCVVIGAAAILLLRRVRAIEDDYPEA